MRGRRGLLAAALVLGLVLVVCAWPQTPQPPPDRLAARFRDTDARTLALARKTATALAPGIEPVPTDIHEVQDCTFNKRGYWRQSIYDFELTWPRDRFDRVALRDATQRYLREQGYDLDPIGNPDSDAVSIGAQAGDFGVEVLILEYGHRMVVGAAGPCLEVDRQTFLDT